MSHVRSYTWFGVRLHHFQEQLHASQPLRRPELFHPLIMATHKIKIISSLEMNQWITQSTGIENVAVRNTSNPGPLKRLKRKRC